MFYACVCAWALHMSVVPMGARGAGVLQPELQALGRCLPWVLGIKPRPCGRGFVFLTAESSLALIYLLVRSRF